MSSENRIRIIHAGVGEAIIQGRLMQIVRGTLPVEFLPESHRYIVVPPYQRKLMNEGSHAGRQGKHAALQQVLESTGKGVPDDLLLCGREEGFRSLGDGEVLLKASTLYVLDGHQRVGAARALLAAGKEAQPLGVKIILGTTLDEEIDTFLQFNRWQTNVSFDVHYRNSEANPGTDAIRRLAQEDPDFPVVRWDQQKIPGEHLKAHLLYEIVIMLHGYAAGKSLEDTLEAMEHLADVYGTKLLCLNLTTFFKVLSDICDPRPEWDAKKKKENNLQQFKWRAPFLRGLVRLLSTYRMFWDDNLLSVSVDDIKKLRGTDMMRVREMVSRSSANKAMFHLLKERLQAQRSDEFAPRIWEHLTREEGDA